MVGMNKITIILALLISTINAQEDKCWSSVKDKFACCKSSNVKEEGKHMDGAWGYENGAQCGIKERQYNWNIRERVESTKSQWKEFQTKWNNEYRDNFERVAVTPGKDETELNFGWESTTSDKPKIRLYYSEDLKEYKDFSGENKYFRELENKKYYSNQVTITNLKSDSVYYYDRYLNGKWTNNIIKFNTNNKDNFKFVFVGDPQIGGSNDRLDYNSFDYFGVDKAITNDAFNWNVTVNSFFKKTDYKPSLLLSAGDQADSMYDDLYREQQFSGYLLPELMQTIPVAPAVGNHENYSNDFRQHFNVPNPYKLKLHDEMDVVPGYNYYFKYNNVLVVVIESNRNTCFDCEMVISKAVNEYPDADWRIAIFHHDIYGNGNTHSQSDALRLRPCLTGLFDIYKFDLVINGHDHVHTTTKFIHYNRGGKGIYEYEKIKKGEDNINENPKGTFFITANCSSGSKFLDFYEGGDPDYVFGSTQTFTASFGVLDFEKLSGKVKLTINIYDVETHKVIDGPFIFQKDTKEVVEDDE
eukprot:jgi/Orpsp1_1/1184122/evm.model.c7180000088111.1